MNNNDYISVKGARQHNLKNVSLDIPKNKLVVLTGVSGSGKSSFAFDTLYAEGQRRYVESLSTYARQFLGIMDKPDVDSISGLSPAISIDQKTTSKNPRSTVGTVTEIYDYLRLLFARIGHPHCPICGDEISQQSPQEIINQIMTKKGKFYLLSPIVKDRKGEFLSLFENLQSKGYSKVRIDGIFKELSDDFTLIKTNKHTIDVVIDKFIINDDALKSSTFKDRLFDSVSQALKLSDGYLIVCEIKDASFSIPQYPKDYIDHLYSEKFACPKDNISFNEVEPRSFSFNSPHGACPNCTGLGKLLKVQPELIFSNDLSIMEGAILPFPTIFERETWYGQKIIKLCKENNVNMHLPFKDLSPQSRTIIEKEIVKTIESRYQKTESDFIRSEYEKFMREQICVSCNGSRLKKESLSITIDGKNIAYVTSFSISDLYLWTDSLILNKKINNKEIEISKLIINEILGRLKFLQSVGLDYLTLDRVASTLSGGEAQRIRLASQIGSGLSGVLYVLDEPTIGLHQKDNQKLIDTLKHLRDLGNSVVVVEHDEEMMKQSDFIADFGPGAGKNGGQIVACGTVQEIMKNSKSLTGKYLSGKKTISLQSAVENNKLLAIDSKLKIFGASQFNLKNIDVEFPLGKLICISGVSGSGKSTLLVETLYPAIQAHLNLFFKGNLGAYKRIEGLENIDKAILIDQSPIGRTPRSNPATYTGLFDPIRDIFALTRESKAAGYKKGQFSFNLKGGRCEACEGQGQTKIEMQFMSDIWVNCEVCQGKRYNSQTLEINYKGKNISDVLEMTVSEALEFFLAHPKIYQKLETLQDVGLSYMQLGQSATTLSGGEAQRIKLAKELSRRLGTFSTQSAKTFYLLDEPTTGLHFADVERLLKILKLLVARGNTVCIIEHNLDVIKNCDWIIDLGPEGGDRGGYVVATGTVNDIKNNKNSVTGKYLY